MYFVNGIFMIPKITINKLTKAKSHSELDIKKKPVIQNINMEF